MMKLNAAFTAGGEIKEKKINRWWISDVIFNISACEMICIASTSLSARGPLRLSFVMDLPGGALKKKLAKHICFFFHSWSLAALDMQIIID